MQARGFQIGPYAIRSRLGRGGMGEVWLATRGETPVVVKTLLPHLADDPRILEAFKKEARIAAMLSSPNVVKILELGADEDRHFLVLEYVEGVSLDKLLAHAGRLPPPLAAYIAAEACAGLSAIHEQAAEMKIVHRDISPSNLLLSVDGEVKVTDFGIAKTFTTDPGHNTTIGTTKGKIGYMSPEQAQANPVDPRTDVFALGVVLFEMLAGRGPYAPTKNDYEMLAQVVHGRRLSISSLVPDVPVPLRTALEKAMAQKPDERLSSARSFREALVAYVKTVSPAPGRRDVGERVKACLAAQKPGAALPRPGAFDAGHGQQVTVDGRLRSPRASVQGPAPTPPSAIAAALDAKQAAVTGPKEVRRSRFGVVTAVAVGGLALVGAVVAGRWSRGERDVEVPQQKVRIELNGQAQVTPKEKKPALPEEPSEPPGEKPVEKAEPSGVPAPVVQAKRAQGVAKKTVAPQKVMLSTEPRCDVYVEGKLKGRAPLELSLEGPTPLRLVSEQAGVDYDLTFTPEAEQSEAKVVVPRATLQVRVNPWAQVSLDGRPVGETPLAPTEVYAGRHVLELVNEKLSAKRTVEVTLAPGETRVVREKLSE